MDIKTCENCGNKIVVGISVFAEEAATLFYCLDDKCTQAALKKARERCDERYEQKKLCTFGRMHKEPCGCDGVPAITNGLCEKHAAMHCSYADCDRPVARECFQSIMFECFKPVCNEHKGCCNEHVPPK